MSSPITAKRFSASRSFACAALPRFVPFAAFALRSFAHAALVAFVPCAAFALAACGRQAKDEPQERAPAAEAEQAPAAEARGLAAERAPAAEARGPAAEPAAAPQPSAAPSADLEIVTADDLKRKVRASGRKGTLVNAWASFCGPCKREVPMLTGVAEKLRPRGLEVVLVSLDEPADGEKARAFLLERKITLESYIAERPLGPFKMGMNPRWRGMLPASFLFDANGVLRYFWGGEAYESEVVPVLEAFLAGKPLDGEANFPVAPEAPPSQ